MTVLTKAMASSPLTCIKINECVNTIIMLGREKKQLKRTLKGGGKKGHARNLPVPFHTIFSNSVTVALLHMIHLLTVIITINYA